MHQKPKLNNMNMNMNVNTQTQPLQQPSSQINKLPITRTNISNPNSSASKVTNGFNHHNNVNNHISSASNKTTNQNNMLNSNSNNTHESLVASLAQKFENSKV